MCQLKINKRENGVTFECRLSPKSSRNKIKGIKDGRLLVSLTAPPVEGRANEALIEFIASLFSVAKSRVKIIKGEHSREKTLFIEGIDSNLALSLLGENISHNGAAAG